MSTSSLRRKVLVLLLLASVLAAPGAFAGPRRPVKSPEPVPRALVSRAWSFLASLWSKTGCNIDPDGRCIGDAGKLPLPQDHADTGCQIDPNGRCGS
ncbi:MAG TPA: hypothetical protein VKK31_14740 [Thermoanaerobaculia bacterium]|nr:hypothetical protein [Thermoanaerobaculia bacterium]